MKAKVTQWSWVGLLCLGASGLMSVADEPARDKGAPIIFSEPGAAKSSLMSSNLSELRKPQAPLRQLETDLNRPLGLFQFNDANNIARPFRPATPPPAAKKKSAKEDLNEKVENAYLFQGLNGANTLNDDDLFGLSDKDSDSNKSSPRKTLERYYDRLDQARGAVTNQTGESLSRSGDSLGLEKVEVVVKPENTKANNEVRPEANVSLGRNAYLPSVLPNSESISASRMNENIGMYRNAKTSLGDSLSGSSPQLSAREARMEDFRRLLEGPRALSATPDANVNSANSSPNFNAPNPTMYSGDTTVRGSGLSSPSLGSSPKMAPASPQQEFVKSANLMGDPLKPQGLSELKALPGLQDAPRTLTPPIQQAPVSTFKIPKRRF